MMCDAVLTATCDMLTQKEENKIQFNKNRDSKKIGDCKESHKPMKGPKASWLPLTSTRAKECKDEDGSSVPQDKYLVDKRNKFAKIDEKKVKEAEILRQMVYEHGCRVNKHGDPIVERGMGKKKSKHAPRHKETSGIAMFTQEITRQETGWLNKFREKVLTVNQECYCKIKLFTQMSTLKSSVLHCEQVGMVLPLVQGKLPSFAQPGFCRGHAGQREIKLSDTWNQDEMDTVGNVVLHTNSWDYAAIEQIAADYYTSHPQIHYFGHMDWQFYVCLCVNCFLESVARMRSVPELQYAILPHEIWNEIFKMCPQYYYLPTEYRECLPFNEVFRVFSPLQFKSGDEVVDMNVAIHKEKLANLVLNQQSWSLTVNGKVKIHKWLPHKARNMWSNTCDSPSTLTHCMIETGPTMVRLYSLIPLLAALLPKGLVGVKQKMLGSVEVKGFYVTDGLGAICVTMKDIHSMVDSIQQLFDSQGCDACEPLSMVVDPGGVSTSGVEQA